MDPFLRGEEEEMLLSSFAAADLERVFLAGLSSRVEEDFSDSDSEGMVVLESVEGDRSIVGLMVEVSSGRSLSSFGLSRGFSW